MCQHNEHTTLSLRTAVEHSLARFFLYETLAERCRKAACVRHAYHTTGHQCRNGDAVSAALPPAAEGQGKGCFPPIETMRENKREAEERREKTKELPRRSFDTYSVLPRNSFRPSSVSRCMLALLLVSQSTIGHSDTSPLLRRGTLKTLSRTQPSQAGF